MNAWEAETEASVNHARSLWTEILIQAGTVQRLVLQHHALTAEPLQRVQLHAEDT